MILRFKLDTLKININIKKKKKKTLQREQQEQARLESQWDRLLHLGNLIYVPKASDLTFVPHQWLLKLKQQRHRLMLMHFQQLRFHFLSILNIKKVSQNN